MTTHSASWNELFYPVRSTLIFYSEHSHVALWKCSMPVDVHVNKMRHFRIFTFVSKRTEHLESFSTPGQHRFWNCTLSGVWDCHGNSNLHTRELKIETFSGRRQLQPDVTSSFVGYCACSCSPPCRRGPVGDVKLVCLALWGKREYLTVISIRFVAFSNEHFADYRS